ncbi:MAG TPA: histidine kinase [Pyrinomonadaceae bacterium]|nr:histidine kinase [Pyrinomonadaceae bacterium]
MFEFLNEGAGRREGWRHQLVRHGFIWGAWTLVGLFFASQIYFYLSRTEWRVSVAVAVAWQLIAVYMFAAATPLVLWLARRFPFERFHWRRNLLVHVFAGLAISAAWGAGHVALDTWFSGGISKLTAANLARRIFFSLDKELLVYWLLVLASHASNYYQRYREGELRASQAQLQALKMQLHPHFLFNALHSISALVHKDPDAADKMIARLGDFLRLTLDTAATQEVALRQELNFLNCYLEIERIRFHDRLTTRLHVEPQTLGCRVPNLILQPIVENAIRHGVAVRSAPGHVEVRAERRGEMLRLQVRDNGPGLPTEPAAHKKSEGGVGLSNTRARLAQLYGAAYRFELENAPEGGTVVTLEIPFQSLEEKSDAARPARVVGREPAFSK